MRAALLAMLLGFGEAGCGSGAGDGDSDADADTDTDADGDTDLTTDTDCPGDPNYLCPGCCAPDMHCWECKGSGEGWFCTTLDTDC